jgi:hypothetical protein
VIVGNLLGNVAAILDLSILSDSQVNAHAGGPVLVKVLCGPHGNLSYCFFKNAGLAAVTTQPYRDSYLYPWDSLLLTVMHSRCHGVATVQNAARTPVQA